MIDSLFLSDRSYPISYLKSKFCFFYYLIHIVKNVKDMVNDDVSISG